VSTPPKLNRYQEDSAMKYALLGSLLAVTFSSHAYAQPNPVVTMTVTTPDGRSQDITAPESGLSEVTLADGTKIGVRPTILDSKPWTRVVVTFFKMPTATSSSAEIGEVEAKTGGPAVSAKTTPVFKVAVKAVAEPATVPNQSTR